MPSLDGLRAFAVIAVVLYHLGLRWIPGGFLGVDVFFVISGFLITTLLVEEARRTARVRVGRFWLRRTRRLVPALIVVVVVVSALTSVIGRDLNAGLRMQVLGAAVYGSNWFQVASGASYVERYEPQVFTHLWSLAVEEQFYLLWPVVVVVLLSFLSRRLQVSLLLAAAAGSAVWMAYLYVPGGDPTRVYVGTDTHGFALLLGAALGLSGLMARRVRSGGWLAPAGVAGSMVVLAGMLLLGDSAPATFRGGLVVVDVAALSLVAAAARGAGPIGTIFGLPPFVWVGKRSYGIYLWHWPLIVITARVLSPGTPSWLLTVIVMTGTAIAATASYRWIEVPIRTRGWLASLRVLRDLVAGRTAAGRRPRLIGVTGVVALVAAAAVTTSALALAPAHGTLADQLAVGEAALASHRATRQVPESRAGTPKSSGTVGTSKGALTPLTTGAVASVAPAGIITATSPRSQAVLPTPRQAPTAGSTTAGTSAPHVPTRTTTSLAPAPPAPTPPRSVTAIGDSIMVGAAPDLLEAFSDISIDAVKSRQYWDLADVVHQHAADGDLGTIVVVALGTNGTWGAAQIVAALEPVGDRPVVLVNTFVARPWSADVNEQIAVVAADRPHTCVADWHSLVAAHPDWISYDGVHPDEDGRRAYTAMLRRAVGSCR
jgi:peptidoglycan/LPS O-acetylase OafA/YrhL